MPLFSAITFAALWLWERRYMRRVVAAMVRDARYFERLERDISIRRTLTEREDSDA